MDRHAPSKDEVLASRWLRPFGERVRASELWRFTRRSVPRGVFAGLFIGIFLMIPGLQIVGAAMLSIPMRANIPIAAAMTFLSNPATTPFFLHRQPRGRQPARLPRRPCQLRGAAPAPCRARRMVRLAVDRRRAGDGVGTVPDRAWRGACRIYRVARRMALVDRAQVATAEQQYRLSKLAAIRSHLGEV